MVILSHSFSRSKYPFKIPQIDRSIGGSLQFFLMEARAEAEFWLPDPIIQLIQHLLSGKIAAQTSILSKSWYSAWLTRPNLDFDERHFQNHALFLKISNNTLQRYADLNLNITTFKLRIITASYSATQLIEKAIKVGATDINFKIYPSDNTLDLPYAVFTSETLVKLSVSGCKIENMRMLALKSLFLEKVSISALFFSDFSSKFPCLKNLVVKYCSEYKRKIEIHSQSLEFITFFVVMPLKAKFDVPSLRKFSYSSGCCLPSLSFENSSNWVSDIRISCTNSIASEWFLRLNELLFNLRSSKVCLSVEMFSRFDYNASVGEEVEGLPKPVVENLILRTHSDFPSSVYPALFGSLFSCCRPMLITQYDQRTIDEDINNEFLKIAEERLNQHITLNCCTANQSMVSEFDLKKADVEFFDAAVSAWRPLLVTSLLDAEQQVVRFHLRWGRKCAPTLQ